ncbi:MAG: tetratricopeptide repeat protein [Oligoflexia bacterium]|nr:tetratricopeptide repeat protein [Oligoflexia bacterium]
MKLRDLFILILFTLTTTSIYADALSDAFKNYSIGEYRTALKILETKRIAKKDRAAKEYLKGIINNKLQQFDKAIPHFQRAIKYKSKAKDLFYEFGQALYAANSLDDARIAFRKSYRRGFKKASSLYYMAHISQLLEEHKQAKDIFSRIIKEEKEDFNLLQISRFQLAESLLAMATSKKETERLVADYVIPQMNKAIEVDKKSRTAKDIKSRIKELQKQYGLDPNIMKNGKNLPEQRWSVGFTQEIEFDNNITQSTDLPTSQASQKDSYIYNTTVNGSYLFNPNNKFTVKPNFRIANKKHSDRNSSTVFKNDSLTIDYGVGNTFEHTLFNRQANAILDLDFSYISRDRNSIKEKEYYARSWTLTLGENLKFTDLGNTTFKIQYKDYKGYIDSLNNKTGSFSISHSFITNGTRLWILFFQSDFIDNYNDRISSTNSYLFRGDYLWINILKDHTLSFGLAITLLDTKRNYATRGMEKTITPSVTWTRNLNKYVSTNLSYEYTKNDSKDEGSYKYTKHVTSFDLSVSF